VRHIYTDYGVADWNERWIARADDENGAEDDAVQSDIERTAFLVAFAALSLVSEPLMSGEGWLTY